MERSLRSYRYGWCSLIPLIGIVPALLAFRDIRFVRRTCGTEWNPANKRLKFGKSLAVVGLFISILMIGFVAFVLLLKLIIGSGTYDY